MLVFRKIWRDEFFCEQEPISFFDALRDLVLFVQFKEREIHTWRGEPATLLKVTLLHGFFSSF